MILFNGEYLKTMHFRDKVSYYRTLIGNGRQATSLMTFSDP